MDPLNSASKKALIKENVNYFSFHVKQEVNIVARRKNREYHKFLQKIADLINNVDDSSLIDFSKIHRAINKFQAIGELDVDDMHSAIDVIWDKLDFDENTDAFRVKSNFSNYCHNFHQVHRNCKNRCFKKMECIPAYRQKDKSVLAKIDKKSLRGEDCLHGEDEEILFDVHDYLKNNHDLDLLFVSGDKRFVKAISILIDVLAFTRFIYLDDLVKN